MASVQLRLGPATTGIYGLLQPLADGLKLLSSELLIPSSSLLLSFTMAPILLFLLSYLL